ncbi:MAG TPA: 4-hydroxy-3-methylbut-2-enyl diphosphate reductase [Desulfonatronum sp.]|nr:4-hydroxy-3-methylbut-2-enyl diphosphate reductase [Desulfonatronum sp.]
MNIILAETAGFCMGVDLALRKLDALLREPEVSCPVFTLGPIIHNPQVLDHYKARGVRQLDDPFSLRSGQSVVVRAHGIPKNIEQELRARGVHLVDATCPKVKKAQLLIARQAAQGRIMLLLGEADHPEVRGLLSYAESGARVLESEEDLEAVLREGCSPCFLAAQTTQDRKLYDRMSRILRRLDPDMPILDTICAATTNRQTETRHIAGQVQAMIVVGGRTSGNTRRLVQVAEQSGIPCFHVETLADLPVDSLRGLNSVGVTAGASTPADSIQGIINHLKSL